MTQNEPIAYQEAASLIGQSSMDTCNNVHAVLSLLRQLHSNTETGGLELTPIASHGLWLVHGWLLDALACESRRLAQNDSATI